LSNRIFKFFDAAARLTALDRAAKDTKHNVLAEEGQHVCVDYS
jgi:hypothetical protein